MFFVVATAIASVDDVAAGVVASIASASDVVVDVVVASLDDVVVVLGLLQWQKQQLTFLIQQPINHHRHDADKRSLSWVYRPEIPLLFRAEVCIQMLCKKRICMVWKRCIPHNSRLVRVSVEYNIRHA